LLSDSYQVNQTDVLSIFKLK